MSDKEQIEQLKAALSASNAALSAAVARISELEALVLKLATKKTSKNSHNSPSGDKGRKNQSLREKSGKKVGGQKGHEGKTLEMSSTPDLVEEIYPNYCNECGEGLESCSFDLLGRRQVIDIPPIVPIVTEYQCFGTTCTCGHYQCGSFPQGVSNHVQYGPNIQSLVVYQSYYQFLPFARLQDFFSKICQVKISKGTIENILRRTARKAEPVYQNLKEAVENATILGSDETSFRSNGSRNWFWVWQNTLFTYLFAATTRGKVVIQEQFPDGLPNAVLVSDRLAAQLSTFTKAKQICLPHLLRELNFLIETERASWATNFRTLLLETIALKKQKASYDTDDPEVKKIEERLDVLLQEDNLLQLLNDPIFYRQTIIFLKGMIKLRTAILPFLYHKDIPFDNNGSERAFRTVKVKTKISGQFKSLQHEFAVIRSVIDSAVKNGQSVFNAISILVDTPMPPPPEAAG